LCEAQSTSVLADVLTAKRPVRNAKPPVGTHAGIFGAFIFVPPTVRRPWVIVGRVWSVSCPDEG